MTRSPKSMKPILLSLVATAAMLLSSCSSKDIALARQGLDTASRMLDVLAPRQSAKSVINPQP